jgi:ferredoxin
VSQQTSQRSSIRIDWTTCDRRGLCAELLPELIALDEWGFPVVHSGPIPGELLRHARRAAAACPTLALHIEADRRS